MTKKILLADDSITIQKVVNITLAHEDFDLTIVDNGNDAVAKAKEIRPDAILLDVMMPGKDGYQACEAIKSMAAMSKVPIILLTGTFEPFDEERAAMVGADDFIKKPFESHTLISKIKERLFISSGGEHVAPAKGATDDFDFATPDEVSIPKSSRAKGVMESDALSDFDDSEMETPWEDDIKSAGPASTKSTPKDEIWSIKEFDDISGGEKGQKQKQAPEQDDLWDETLDEPSYVSRVEKTPPGAKNRSTRTETTKEKSADDFELGEEISEDELKRFLEEEGIDDISDLEGDFKIGGEKKEDDFSLPQKEPRGKTETYDDFILDDFEEPASNVSGKSRTRHDHDFLDDDVQKPGTSFHLKSDEEDLLMPDRAKSPRDIEWEIDEPKQSKKAESIKVHAPRREDIKSKKEDIAFQEFTFQDEEVPTDLLDIESNKADELDFTSFEDYDEEPFDEKPLPKSRGISRVIDTVIEDNAQEISSLVRDKISKSGVTPENTAGMNEKDISKLVNSIARDVIERVAWEVVPELAEELIKEEIRRLKGEKV